MGEVRWIRAGRAAASQTLPIGRWNALSKRVEDIVIGSLMLPGALILGIMIALAVKLSSPGPVLFQQWRFGFNDKTIRVLKFRTMYHHLGDVSGAERTVQSDPRVTPLGRFLRAHSLDELPQLYNVLRGDMSLVGPRPHALAMKAGGDLYHDAVAEYSARHRVRPGITGWAQVNGCRGEIGSLEQACERLRYDLEYIDNWSLWLDVKILVRSIPALLGHDRAY